MTKKIILISGIVLIGLTIWYLFIKPFDYIVSIKAKTFSGTINQTIKLWSLSLENSSIIEQNDLNHLIQKVSFNDSTYIYNWKINSINDSSSVIKIYIKDINHSLDNKISILLGNTDFEKRTKNTILDFNKKLKEHLSKFKVTIKGENELNSTYCAYVPIKTNQIGKARGMMKNYSLLSSVLAENNVKLNGLPFVEITYWDMKKDSIEYDFCYPIFKSDSLPIHKIIKYKQFEGKKAIKAIYNGNYITSDRAWYALIDYANKKNIETVQLPIEVFYNNPNMGGDALKWKAEVYLPIK
jgi:effector-binding domain-containing protein